MKMQELRIHYAKLHGYDLYSLGSEPTRPRLTRRESTQLLIDNTDCDYIFWLSVDAVIVDINFEIESLIKWQGASDTDLVVAGNYAVVSLVTGLWKSSSFNSLLLKELSEIEPGNEVQSATASMSALLGGCTVRSSEDDKEICRAKVIQPKRSRDPAILPAIEAIRNGDDAALGEMVVNKSLLPHMKWVPTRLIGARPEELFVRNFDYKELFVRGVFLVYCSGIFGGRYIPKILPTARMEAGLAP
jgi:hypothetical protein